jgi:hypothetical protein
VMSLLMLVTTCAVCCLGREEFQSPPVGCVCLLLSLACCVPLVGCTLALFVWPFGIVYYLVCVCMYGGDVLS